MPDSTPDDYVVEDSPPQSPLQAIRSHLGTINSLTQREVDMLLARLRARGRPQDEG